MRSLPRVGHDGAPNTTPNYDRSCRCAFPAAIDCPCRASRCACPET